MQWKFTEWLFNEQQISNPFWMRLYFEEHPRLRHQALKHAHFQSSNPYWMWEKQSQKFKDKVLQLIYHKRNSKTIRNYSHSYNNVINRLIWVILFILHPKLILLSWN